MGQHPLTTIEKRYVEDLKKLQNNLSYKLQPSLYDLELFSKLFQECYRILKPKGEARFAPISVGPFFFNFFEIKNPEYHHHRAAKVVQMIDENPFKFVKYYGNRFFDQKMAPEFIIAEQKRLLKDIIIPAIGKNIKKMESIFQFKKLEGLSGVLVLKK